jgi:hypothetical protein
MIFTQSQMCGAAEDTTGASIMFACGLKQLDGSQAAAESLSPRLFSFEFNSKGFKHCRGLFT